MIEPTFKVSEYLAPLYEIDFFEADVWGGRGRGGSHGLTQHALFSMMTRDYFRGYFVRANFGSIRDSLWLDFKDRIEEQSDLDNYNYLNDFHIKDHSMEAIYLPNGNSIKSKGFRASSKSNTANMKSIANATHIYGEEWEEVGEEENNKLMDSLRTIKGKIQILRSFNPPPKDHWIWKYYYNLEPSGIDGYMIAKPKGIDKHISLFGTYLVNKKNLNSDTVARYERYKETSPKYYYNQIKGLISDGGDKKVYYGWKPITFAQFQIQEASHTVYGVDFGDVSPCSVIKVKYKDGRLYRHQVLYESLRSLAVKYSDQITEIRRRLNSEIPDDTNNNIWTKHKGLLTYVFDLIGIDKNLVLFCDPAQRSLIIELRLAGYKAVEANKNKSGNIMFINRAENFYTDTSVEMEDEYNGYYLEEDANKNPIDGKPKGGNDHAMHAQEYGCAGIRDMGNIQL